ncbi:MAG: hypothetical protein JNL67_05345 [Planctomycetaceae bacterium]|nr:hypothetical protein [Planctomycetaceae bacterium]
MPTAIRKLWLLLLLGFVQWCSSVHARDLASHVANDPASRIDAKIYVTPNRVRMVLGQFSDDLVWLHGMEASEQGLFSPEQLRENYEYHKKFIAQQLQVIDVHGKRLTAVLVDEGPYPFDDPLFKDGATEFHLVRRRMNFTYEYHSPDVRLDTFTIRHSVVDENFLYPAELSLELFQGESDLPLKGKLRLDSPMTVDLDWESPVPTQSASDAEKLAWLSRQDERLLGVTNFGATYLWAYVEPRQLRVELLIPLNVLATLFEIQSADPDFLQRDEMIAAEQRIRKYFATGNQVAINGLEVPAQIQSVDFFPADQRDFALRREVERISMANGRVGVSFAYPYRDVPREIQLSWDKFGYGLQSVQGYMFFGEEVQTQVFSRQLAENRLLWKNSGVVKAPDPVKPVPVNSSDLIAVPFPLGGIVLLSLAAIAMGLLIGWFVHRRGRVALYASVLIVWIGTWYLGWQTRGEWFGKTPPNVQASSGDAAAKNALESLYRAFDFVQDAEIYSAMENCVAGAKLRDLYLQLLRDLQVEEQGGTVSRIESVEVLNVEAVNEGLSLPSQKLVLESLDLNKSTGAVFQRRVQWKLTGLLEHWGHSHQRTNQYQALLTIADHDGHWKIIDLEIESQTTGTVQPRPNRFRPSRSSG